MSEALSEHGRRILAGIIPGRSDLLDLALNQLDIQHFPDPTQRTLFQLLRRYDQIGRGGVMGYSALSDLLKLQKADAGKAALLLESFEALEEESVADDAFHFSVFMLLESEAEKATIEALTTSMEVLRTGARDDDGNEIKGHAAAREVVQERFAEIERGLSVEQSPEGDTRTGTKSLLQDYYVRKEVAAAGQLRGIGFGIASLDAVTGGMQPGEFVLAAGYSNDGKSSLCVQAAWSAAVEQSKNVVVLTMETPYSAMYRKLICRHSRLPQFELPEGINTHDVKNGTLSDVEEVRLAEVLNDYEEGDYGRIYMAQLPYGSTIDTVTVKLRQLSKLFKIDLVVIDYLGLLRSPRKRQTKREELSEILIGAKELATTFDNGRGVCVLSPWQVNRAARDEANKLGRYTSAALAETAEATNSPDLVISIMAPEDNHERVTQLKGQILKARDGATHGDLRIMVDYGTSAFWSDQVSARLESGSNGLGMGGVLGGLLGG